MHFFHAGIITFSLFTARMFITNMDITKIFEGPMQLHYSQVQLYQSGFRIFIFTHKKFTIFTRGLHLTQSNDAYFINKISNVKLRFRIYYLYKSLLNFLQLCVCHVKRVFSVLCITFVLPFLFVFLIEKQLQWLLKRC